MYTGSLGAVSNAEDWTASFNLFAADGITPVSVLGANVWLYITRPGQALNPMISGTEADYITISADGLTLSWTVPYTALNKLSPGEYNVYCRMLLNGAMSQLLSASVGIIDGGPV